MENDPLAAFFESERGERLWQQWCLGAVSNQQVKDQYGEDVLEAVIASELILQQQAQRNAQARDALTKTASTEDGHEG